MVTRVSTGLTRLVNGLLGCLLSFSLNATEFSVIDYQQRSVTLAKPAKRIVALAPHIVENVFSAGVGDRLVGAVDYSDYPAEALDIPRIGGISAYSYEAIVALKPDLVLVWYSGHGSQALSALEALGVTVYADDPRTLTDVARSIRDIGVLTDNLAAAEPVAKAFEQRYQALRAQYSERAVVSVFYQVWNDPLQTLNDAHIISDGIRLCGGRNVFGDQPAIAPVVSREAVLHADPDAIIASGMGEERPEWLDEWRRFETLTSVKQQQLFFIPPDIIQRHTVRLLDGVTQLCDALEQVRRNQG